MANPFALEAEMADDGESMIVICNVEFPPLKTDNGLPNGIQLWKNQPSRGPGNATPAPSMFIDAGDVGPKKIYISMPNSFLPILRTDSIHFAFNAGFGHIFDQNDAFLLTISPADAILAHFLPIAKIQSAPNVTQRGGKEYDFQIIIKDYNIDLSSIKTGNVRIDKTA